MVDTSFPNYRGNRDGMNVWDVGKSSENKDGYIQIAEFKVVSYYANIPILLTVQKRKTQSEHIEILLTNMEKPEEATLNSFWYFGGNFLSLYQDSESKAFKLYAKKEDPFAYISVVEFQLSDYMKQRISWTWTDIFTETLPEGVISPTPYSWPPSA